MPCSNLISWVLSTEQHLLCLFHLFHFKDAVTFSWILQWAGWPRNSLIFNSIIISAWSYLSRRPGPENACEGWRRSPLTGKAHVIWELSLKCTTNVIFSCSGVSVGCASLDLVVVLHTTIAQLLCSSEMLRQAQPEWLGKFIAQWVYRFNSPEPFLFGATPSSLSSNCQSQSVVCNMFSLTYYFQIADKFTIPYCWGLSSEDKCQFS